MKINHINSIPALNNVYISNHLFERFHFGHSENKVDKQRELSFHTDGPNSWRTLHTHTVYGPQLNVTISSCVQRKMPRSFIMLFAFLLDWWCCNTDPCLLNSEIIMFSRTASIPWMNLMCGASKSLTVIIESYQSDKQTVARWLIENVFELFKMICQVHTLSFN